jgi:hypothetical protein
MLGLDAAKPSFTTADSASSTSTPSPARFGGPSALPRVAPAPLAAGTPVRLFDTFPFNGELVAEVRLNATAHFFHHVYVVEAWQPHSIAAPRKPFLYSQSQYWQRVWARFPGKVTVVVVEEFPPVPASWALQVGPSRVHACPVGVPTVPTCEPFRFHGF